MPAEITRQAADALDRDDPLAPLRARFVLPPGLRYFDGNSLGPLARASRERVADVLERQWGRDLVASWNRHGWIDLSRRTAGKIARLIGAAPDEVAVTDSTSVNLFKLLSAALDLKPGRTVIVSQPSQFPTDLYMAEGLAALRAGVRLRLAESEELTAAIDRDVAVVSLSHVDFRSGERHDLAAVTRAAHRAGALVLWDLSHSAGAMEIDLEACGADLAVGCTYKFLNGGPGAPAFVYVARQLQQRARSPLWGWFGHRDPFAFDVAYRPAPGIDRFQCGTPPILSLAALDAALDLFDDVELGEVRRKSVALGELFLERVSQACPGLGLGVASPAEAERRGSQVSLTHPEGFRVVQALIERGVVGDFRAPDVLRFGLSPLFLRYADVFEAVAELRSVLESRAWDHPRFERRGVVT